MKITAILLTTLLSVLLSGCKDATVTSPQPGPVRDLAYPTPTKKSKRVYSNIYHTDKGYTYTQAPSPTNDDLILWYILFSHNNTPYTSSNYYSSAPSATYWRPATTQPVDVVKDTSRCVELSQKGPPTESYKSVEEVHEELAQGEAQVVASEEPSVISQEELNQENWQEEGPEGWAAQFDKPQEVEAEPQEVAQEQFEQTTEQSSETTSESTDTSSSDSGSSDSGSSDSGGGDSGGGSE